MKYILKGRPINFTTNILALAIDLLDGKDIKNHWNLRVLVPNKNSSTQLFILSLESFIRDVIIIDSVLNSICAFNLMKFQNKFKDHDLSKEENARLDNLRRRMLSICITIIEHENLFFSVAPFPKTNKISQCFDTTNKTKIYLRKCRHQKVCLKHLISKIFV